MGTAKQWSGLILSDRAQPTDVEALYRHFYKELYNSASRIILIDGLPETADVNFVMTHLLTVGSIAVIEHKNKIYMTNGHLGGSKDANYYGTRVIGANPVLGSFDLERGKQGEVIYLTPFDNIPLMAAGDKGGLHSLISFTAALLADNLCSLNTAQINGRVQAIITAEDASIATTAELVMKDLYAGKPYRVLTEEFYKRIHVNPCASSVQSHQLMELVEVQQYIRAMFWNAIGIDSNYNMKRERLVTAEVESNFTALKVPVTTMINNLNDGFEKANKWAGTKLKARLNPEYKIVKSQEKEVKNNEPDSTPKETDPQNGAGLE